MTDLFTYGSLMCADIMERVAGCRVPCRQALLQGFFRSGISGEDYPGIFARPGASVAGVLYLDLPEEAVRRLDIFEGELYERQEVEVIAGGSRSLAMTYVVKDCYRHRLTGGEWSYDLFLRTGKARFEKDYLGFGKI